MINNSHIKQNIVKNILVLLLAICSYPIILNSLTQIKFEQTNDFLLTISMILVTVCFANFAFTYEKSKLQTRGGALLAHCATGVFMLLTALLLESISIAFKVVYPTFYFIISGFSILLYIGVILYDFWDLMRG
ncbi:MAG TPA: hypothetical protein DEB09_00935 [Candidatus Magasanikbacteria bacterium]|nr:hypothetical protein [Candidatus Magasanikbacteria bacterium]